MYSNIDRITSLERMGMQFHRDFQSNGCAEIAEAGFNGVFINGGSGVCCDIFPEVMTESTVIKDWMPQTVAMNKREIARRAALFRQHNLSPWLLMNGVPGPDDAAGGDAAAFSQLNDRLFKMEMRAMREKQPELFGNRRWAWRGNHPLCVSHPQVQKFYSELMPNLFRDLPDLRGMLYFPGDNEPEQCDSNCPRCGSRGKHLQDLMIEHVNRLYASAIAVKPDFRLYVSVWNHHLPGMEESARHMIENLAPGIGICLVMADHVVEIRRAGEFRFNQPWVICPGIGNEFLQRAELARANSRNVMIMGEIAQSEVWDPVCHNMPNPEKTLAFLKNAESVKNCDVIFDFWGHRGPYRGHINFDAMRTYLDHPELTPEEQLRLAAEKYYQDTDLTDEGISCLKAFEKACDEWALVFWCHRFSFAIGRDGARGALFRPLVPKNLSLVKTGWAWSLFIERQMDIPRFVKEQLADSRRFIKTAQLFREYSRKLLESGNKAGAEKARLDALNIEIAGELIGCCARTYQAAQEWEEHNADALRKTVQDEIDARIRVLELTGEIGYSDAAGVNPLLMKEDIQNMMYYLSSPDFPDTDPEKFQFTYTPYTI